MLFQISSIGPRHYQDVCHLYAVCFDEDPHFQQSGVSFEQGTPPGFCKDILVVLREGLSLGSFVDGKLIGGLLVFNTNMRHEAPSDFDHIFGVMPDVGVYPYKEELLDKIPDNALYLLAGFVDSAYRGQGVYRGLLNHLLSMYPRYAFVSDVSNMNTMRLYRRLGFTCSEIALDYYFIHREGARCKS